MSVLHGSCLCGRVKFEITGALTPPSNCHCSMCRKQQGAAFRSRARVRADDFRWVQGEGLVKFFESTTGTFRGFCGECGSPIINKFDTRAKAARVPSRRRCGIWYRAGDARRRSRCAPRPSHLCRQQSAVVRDHRRLAAIFGVSAPLLEFHRRLSRSLRAGCYGRSMTCRSCSLRQACTT